MLQQIDPCAQVESLWNAYYRPLHGYIRSKVRDGDSADDITSNTFLRAFEACQDGRGPSSSERGWIYRIAKNMIVDHYRWHGQPKRQEVVPLDEMADVLADQTDRTLGRVEDAAYLETLTDDLLPRQKEMVDLYLLGYDGSEALGEVLGISSEVASSALHRTCASMQRASLPPKPPKPKKPRKSRAKPADMPRKKRPAPVVDIVIGAIRQYGPEACYVLADRTGQKRRSVNNALLEHPDLFVQVGSRVDGQRRIPLWGLV
jgi:RNA polymerase sigma factor (sigma-70 family)